MSADFRVRFAGDANDRRPRELCAPSVSVTEQLTQDDIQPRNRRRRGTSLLPLSCFAGRRSGRQYASFRSPERAPFHRAIDG